MAEPLVPINEGMVHHEGGAQSCGLGNNIGIEITLIEREARLVDC
jgi:hypothetical protein